jgi:hypothetical protein
VGEFTDDGGDFQQNLQDASTRHNRQKTSQWPENNAYYFTYEMLLTIISGHATDKTTLMIELSIEGD